MQRVFETIWLRKLGRMLADEAGGVALSFGLLLMPIMFCVGCAIDFARVVQAKDSLQAAVDEAALAGAAAFTDPSQQTKAIAVARDHFNRAILARSILSATPTVTANPNGTINPRLGSAAAYTVTVSAQARVSNTLMSLVIPSERLSVSGTAGDPVVSSTLSFSPLVSDACDGNTFYLYKVPMKANGGGYDYGSVPPFSVANGSRQGNYYEIGSSYAPENPLSKAPPGQRLPTYSVNQPMGIMMRNDSNGNVGGSNCPWMISGASTYAAPSGASQYLYSSLLRNNQPTSQYSDYTYTTDVTATTGSNPSIVAVRQWFPPNPLHPTGQVDQPIESAPFNILSQYLGINAPDSGQSNCSSRLVWSRNGIATMRYTCRTQFLKNSTSPMPNCSLYVETGVTEDYVKGFHNGTRSPPEARQCFAADGNSGGAQYAAPTCSQLSALAGKSGGSATLPAAVLWWDDTGSVGPNEAWWGGGRPSHCNGTRVNGPGWGEDCDHNDGVFAMQCTINGGSGSGNTEVVLTQ